MHGFDLTRKLPEQNAETVWDLSIRWLKAAQGQKTWADRGKTCQEFFDGKQWSAEQLAAMAQAKRPSITLNKIAPLVNLVSGYQRNNRMDIKYLASSDGASSENVAEVLSHIVKAENSRNDVLWTDSEVFMDGIITGRGYWDMRLNFEENDLGEGVITSSDPFSVYIDPDCNDYNLKTASYIQESRWVSPDEVGAWYGKEAEEAVGSLLRQEYSSSVLPFYGEEEISPSRFFGLYDSDSPMEWRDIYNIDFINTFEKRLRMIETQKRVYQVKNCFIDLETGDFKAIPDHWQPEQINKALYHAERLGNPMAVAKRNIQRIRWTVQVADLIIFDDWSPYATFTKIPYFPYFRRGFTQGIVSNLIDPQREINKKRSSITEILNRSANSGWQYHENALDKEQQENLLRHGAKAGINIKWKGDREPKRLEAGGYPQGLDRLEDKASNDMFIISGINESAMGSVDPVQSGRAIEAKQRQAILALQPFLDNFSRSKKIQGGKWLELIQNHYTEHRVFRILGEDGQSVIHDINKQAQGEAGVKALINDITTGKYMVSVDETPMSASFKEAQFEEALMIIEKLGGVGEMILQARPDLLVSMSSLPQKEEWVNTLKQAMGASTAMGSGTVDPNTGQPMQPQQMISQQQGAPISG